MAKPVNKPSWMTGVSTARVVEPTSGKKANGWDIDERPASEYMNWLFQITSDWIDYLDSVAAALDNFATIYPSIVGSGALATHSTLNAAMADSGVGPGSRILIISDLTLTSTQQITKQNCILEFQGGVSIIRGTAATGLQISASGVRIEGGRFSGFSTSGDKAILIDSGSNYTQIGWTRFSNCDTEIDDLASTSQILGTVTE